MKLYRLLQTLEEDGWFVIRQRAGLRGLQQLKHREKDQTLTIGGLPGDELNGRTAELILCTAGAHYG